MLSKCSIALILLAASSGAQTVEPTAVFARIPGVVTCLRFDDTRNGRMVVNRRVEVTSDGGATWMPAANPSVVQPAWMSTLRQPGWKGWSPDTSREVEPQFWQLDNRHGVEVRGSIVLVTSDSGLTWKPAVLPDASPGKISLHFRGSRGWMVTASGQVLTSSDFGSTWIATKIPAEPGILPDEPFVMLTEFYGYMTRGGNTVYETRDGGRNWQPFFTGNKEYFQAIACYASDCWAAASEGRLLHWNAAAALH